MPSQRRWNSAITLTTIPTAQLPTPKQRAAMGSWELDSASVGWELTRLSSPAHDPPIRIVMLEILAAGDAAQDHRPRDPAFLRTDREIDVRDHEADQRHAGQAMRDVGEAPGRI